MNKLNLLDYVKMVLKHYVGDMPAYFTRQQFQNLLFGYDPSLNLDMVIAKQLMEELESAKIIRKHQRDDGVFVSLTENFVKDNTHGVIQEVRLEQLKELGLI